MSKKFVLLFHSLPADSERSCHYDFMIEADDVLWTWELSRFPEASEVLDAIRLADHRRDYLDYEGPVSGDRGTVQQIDAGMARYDVSLAAPPDAFSVELCGKRLRGYVQLVHIDGDRWRFIYSPSTNRNKA